MNKARIEKIEVAIMARAEALSQSADAMALRISRLAEAAATGDADAGARLARVNELLELARQRKAAAEGRAQ